MRTTFFSVLVLFCQIGSGGNALAAEALETSIDDLVQRGEQLFHQNISCKLCHGDNGEGRIGPSLLHGPTPSEIYEQLLNNPQMGVIVQELDPSDEDLVAISAYIRKLGGLPLSDGLISEFREGLKTKKLAQATQVRFAKSARDRAVEKIESFETVLSDWQRRSKSGNIGRTYASSVVATFDPGRAKFKPRKNGVYFYENLGNSANLGVLDRVKKNAASTQIVVGDAITKKVIASYEIPVELRAAVHTTVVSPDGKFVYIVGSKPSGPDVKPSLATPATLLKVDALTLQPVKQIAIGGRLHHGQVFQDRYLLLDTFARDPDGLDILLFDPETDKVIGGVRDEELGGITYTSWSDDEFIYILMEPAGYGKGSSSGMVGATNLNRGKLVAMRPFWVAKVDPDTWEVVKEYPFPGYRGDWIVLDSAKAHMYVTSGGSSKVSKIELATGRIVWTAASGIGPYGASLNVDESEIWIADKGESAGHFGRTITVLETSTGRPVDTLFSGYEVDHVLLSPNGKEMWATSNGEGRIYVFDEATRKQKKVIDMPQFGDPHGLVWVHYDSKGVSRVVRDQGGFRNGVNPSKGKPLNY